MNVDSLLIFLEGAHGLGEQALYGYETPGCSLSWSVTTSYQMAFLICATFLMLPIHVCFTEATCLFINLSFRGNCSYWYSSNVSIIQRDKTQAS